MKMKRQQKWQYKKKKEGKCIVCGKRKIFKSWRCTKCQPKKYIKKGGDMELFAVKLKMNAKVTIQVRIIKNYIKLSNYFIDNYCKQKVRVGYENNKLFIIPTDNNDASGHLIIRRKKENYGYIYCRSSLKKHNINLGIFPNSWDPKRKYLIITLKNKDIGQFSDYEKI